MLMYLSDVGCIGLQRKTPRYKMKVKKKGLKFMILLNSPLFEIAKSKQTIPCVRSEALADAFSEYFSLAIV